MILVDTGFWLALANLRDAHHAQAKAALKRVREPLVTTWPVMAETCHLLVSRLGVDAELAFVRSAAQGAFEVFALEAVHLGRIESLMVKYRDLPMDLADASLVILAEELGLGAHSVDGQARLSNLSVEKSQAVPKPDARVSGHMKANITDLVARTSVLIEAPRQDVWAALLLPDTVTEIMPITEVISGWRLGEPFVWLFELAGTPSRVEGFVLRAEEASLLEYEYADPHSRQVLQRENLHRVTIELADDAGGTRVTVTQDANVSEAALAHAEGGWRLALNNLKGLVEQARKAST